MASLFFSSHLFPLQYLGKSDKHQRIHNVIETSHLTIYRRWPDRNGVVPLWGKIMP